jgi:hypothetical protein
MPPSCGRPTSTEGSAKVAILGANASYHDGSVEKVSVGGEPVLVVRLDPVWNPDGNPTGERVEVKFSQVRHRIKVDRYLATVAELIDEDGGPRVNNICWQPDVHQPEVVSVNLDIELAGRFRLRCGAVTESVIG